MNGAILGAASGGGLASGVSAAMSVVTSMLTAITGNDILLACFCMSILGSAVAVVKSLKH